MNEDPKPETKPVTMFIVSDKMFEHITTRALAIAEEEFRRMVLDTGMSPEGAAIVRVQVVEETADRIIEKWGRMLQEKIKGEA